MNLFVSVLFTGLFLFAPAIRQTPKALAEDFRRLAGAQWTGTLVYLDYGSKKEVSIRSNLTVKQTAEGDAVCVFEFEYPDEPKANSEQTVTLGRDGTTVDDETVVERKSLDGGAVRIVTERRGKDDDKVALIRYTYMISRSSFSIRKEVRPEGASEFFERNRYSWKR